MISGEVGATIVLGRLRAPGPAGWVVEARALQLNARSVRRNEERMLDLVNLFIEKVWRPVVDWLSLEVLLRRHPNGGAMILLRALWVASWVYFAYVVLINVLSPCPDPKSSSPSCRAIGVQVATSVHWFGTILAAAYASLYARYSAQWSYLANVYNRIKETQARMNTGEDAKQALAEWKAGFIEDAEDLHLATKPMFASIINAWSKDPHVQRAFCDHTLGRDERWVDLTERVEKACSLRETQLSAVARRKAKKSA